MFDNYFPCYSMRLATFALDEGCHVDKHINPKNPKESVWFIHIHSERDLDLIKGFFAQQGKPAPASLNRCIERYRADHADVC